MTQPDDTPPTPPVARGGTSKRRLSLIWLVPLAALLAVLAITVRAYMDRGPLIEISFEDAAGIKANSTELRYRDVRVGLVEEVSFTEGLDRVLVAVRVNKDVAPFIDEDAKFWVVRPEVTAQGVSGLNTVLSGVYIEGFWDAQTGPLADRFAGLADAPLERQGQTGLRLTFRASGRASLMNDTPILYRGVTVGRVGKPSITEDGGFAQAEAVIFEPHDRLISSSTRFWDTSGFSFSLGPGGASLDFSSVASLVSGGVTFETVVSGGAPVEPGQTFIVYPEEQAARDSLFTNGDDEVLNLSVVFTENITGLSTEAPVELNGLTIGEVTGLTGLVDPEEFGDNRVRLVASLAIRPARLGLEAENAGPDQALDFLRDRVRDGLRARLASASILTGGLKIELVDAPDAPPAELREREDGTLYLPTTQSDIADVAATAQGVFERINALPIEEVMVSATELFESARRLIDSEDIRQVPQNLNGLLGEARQVVGSDEVQALPEQLGSLVTQLDATVTSINETMLVARLTEAVEGATEAAEGVNSAVAGVPDLVERLTAVANQAEAVDLQDLAGDLRRVLASTEALIGSEDTQAIPERLSSVLQELDVTVGRINETGLTTRLTEAVDAATEAANGVTTSVEGVPELVERLNAVAAKAETVEIQDLADELTALVASADALIGSDDTRALPGRLNSALDELTAVMAELRAGGVVDNAVSALDSASDAADTIAEAGRDLPGLIEQARAVLARANTTLEGYEAGSGLGRDARSALIEVQKAAKAVASLARAIERNPNSLLTGR